MQFLDLTLPSPAENLALDEALLDEAEASVAAVETLRLWESPVPLVVLGRSSRRSQEVREEACAARGIPVLRRSSGGLSIVAGPGCLMYAVVLNCRERPELKSIPLAHQFVLERIATALRPFVPGVMLRGTSDLAVGERKFSGNSLRVKRHHLLYHGTLLYDFPLALIGECLQPPPREPDYRAGRAHTEFVMNLPIDRAVLMDAIPTAFAADTLRLDWPREFTAQLTRERYEQPEWTNEF